MGSPRENLSSFYSTKHDSRFRFLSRNRRVPYKDQKDNEATGKKECFYVLGSSSSDNRNSVKVPSNSVTSKKYKSSWQCAKKELLLPLSKPIRVEIETNSFQSAHSPIENKKETKKNEETDEIKLPHWSRKEIKKMRECLFSPWEPRSKEMSCEIDQLLENRKFNF